MKSTTDEERLQIQAAIHGGVGLYRAEYLGDRIFDLFTPPAYWAKLTGRQPTFLVGGRGTGKTHALRSLAFDGQFALSGSDLDKWSTIGFYWRIETNTVAAFRGKRLPEEDWVRLFNHFVNLQLVRLVLEFVSWRAIALQTETFVDSKELRRASLSLGIGESDQIDKFADAVRDEIAQFESQINQLSTSIEGVNVSMLGRPISYLLSALSVDPGLGNHFFTFCIDEYENLEDYQQQVLNTLIKHVGDSSFTFKIGTKETGLRVRSTLTRNEYMMEPADFISIDVVDELKGQGFAQFAEAVCASRLPDTGVKPLSFSGPNGLFPELSEEDEARHLGVDSRIAEIRRGLKAEGASVEELKGFDRLPTLSAYLVDYWSKSVRSPALQILRDALEQPSAWEVRRGNYSYAMLFTIRRGKSGQKKLYAGWSTLALLADGNMRYFLNLVTLALDAQTSAGKRFDEPVAVSLQTDAAIELGGNMLRELQGLDVRGAQLTRLALGLGRVFGVFAADPYGHTPEVAQFRVKDDGTDAAEVRSLLETATMHSCLKRFAGDKMALVSSETKDFDYQLHPIYAPFFLYSPRSKRRMTVPAHDLVALASASSRVAITRLLKRANRSTEAELPSQLELFSEHFYDLA